jgi:hypothetical protein
VIVRKRVANFAYVVEGRVYFSLSAHAAQFRDDQGRRDVVQEHGAVGLLLDEGQRFVHGGSVGVDDDALAYGVHDALLDHVPLVLWLCGS